MIFKDFPILEHRICFNKISVPFTNPLSVTVGHLRIRFHGEGHRSITDRSTTAHFFNFLNALLTNGTLWQKAPNVVVVPARRRKQNFEKPKQKQKPSIMSIQVLFKN